MSFILEAIKYHVSSALAIIDDNHQFTYGELTAEVQKRADILQDVPVLGLMLDNSAEWILWDLACVKSGTICVPLPPFFTAEQRNYVSQQAGITHILSPIGLVDTGISAGGLIPEGTGKITFTSGTTGTPKGVCLSQGSLEQVALYLGEILNPEFAQRHLSILPLAILLENIAGVYATLLAGGTIFVPSLKTTGFANPFKPDFAALTNYMARHKITSGIMVPELLRGLIHIATPLPALKFLAVGGSKISPSLIQIAQKQGLPVYEGYGLSECGSVVSLNTPDDNKTGSVGKILPHVKIFEKDSEIIIKNPGFLGYINEPHQGTFATGDIGGLDNQGFLHIEGRKKNILITSYGRNISPEWVESVLLSQPEIMQAVVYGDAQPFLSALIACPYGQKKAAEAVERANQLLPSYARIENFQLIAPFNTAEETLTGTGRPRREKIFQKYSTLTKENANELLQSTC